MEKLWGQVPSYLKNSPQSIAVDQQNAGYMH
jgi:hypothetical protein